MGPDAQRWLDALTDLRAHDLPTHGGRTLAYVYDSGIAEADELGRQALAMYASSNGLDPTAFPSLLRMEQDLVAMAGEILHAPEGFVGTVTSGGTESILLAVQTARDASPAVERPRMVLPTSAHAAFHKAAHYFGVEPVFVDVDRTTLRADAAGMIAAIDERTVLVVASAPSYAHGVVDPVVPIAAAAADAGVRCHVDACIGGWVLPFLDASSDGPSAEDTAEDTAGFSDGTTAGPWTFAVPGVTSVSVDLHKYAYTPKGVSLLLHRDATLRRPQFFASASWPGYTMINSTTQSTKSGGPLAAAWAVTSFIGTDGYARLARQARDGLLRLAAAASGIPGLRVVGEPDSTLLALAADDTLDVFTLADEMLARGWFTQPQMSFRGLPATLHLTLSAATAPLVDEAVEALTEAAAAAVAAGPVSVPAEVAGALAGLDPAGLDDAAFDGLLRLAGLDGGEGLVLPDRMGPVNALLDRAPATLREALLVAFLDRLSRPTPTR